KGRGRTEMARAPAPEARHSNSTVPSRLVSFTPSWSEAFPPCTTRRSRLPERVLDAVDVPVPLYGAREKVRGGAAVEDVASVAADDVPGQVVVVWQLVVRADGEQRQPPLLAVGHVAEAKVGAPRIGSRVDGWDQVGRPRLEDHV